jgi:KDO2-lipid IV(A) lauroyltransferase
MAKTRSPLTDYAAYFGCRIGMCILQSVPPSMALWLVETAASIFIRFNRRRRAVAVDNLRQAFPGRYSDEELHEMVLNICRHFATVLLEILLMPRKLTSGNWRHSLDLGEYPRLQGILDTGRPIIVLTAHYGNWELAAHCLGLAGVRSHLVARPIDNPYFDDLVRTYREWTGHKVLSKKGDIRRMNEILDANETLCTLGDQNAGTHGMFVDFFGRPASTHKAIARLAQRSGAVIAVVGMQKTGGLLEYTLRVMDIIRPEEFADHADATRAITQGFTSAVERMVRLDPVQYFWLHRRWKHQPPEAAKRRAA